MVMMVDIRWETWWAVKYDNFVGAWTAEFVMGLMIVSFRGLAFK
jgi:hypothetical protein